MKKTSIQQEDLFLEWNDQCQRLKDLNGIIQNDFTLLLRDGVITKQNIAENLKIFTSLFEEHINKLRDLKESIEAFCNKYIRE